VLLPSLQLGHNLFLAHAGEYDSSGDWNEYADRSGVMGYCCDNRCPNTAHAWQLGWVQVSAGLGWHLRMETLAAPWVASQPPCHQQTPSFPHESRCSSWMAGRSGQARLSP
jgi:hypothetical protein